MKPFVGAEVIPGDEAQSDEAILAELRWLVSPGLHANGTCKMGRDASSSVVDARLRVHGVQGLRVVDASIMPTPVSGNTNATAMVIGARAAELILADRSAPSGAR
jgi:choline dehydrogenase